MRLSTRGRYGVRALAELAGYPRNQAVSLKEIAGRQGISLHYLEQLFRKLRKAGLVKSARGPHGGFFLARPARDIPVWEIVVCLEQEAAPVQCVDDLTGKRRDHAACR